MGQVEFCRNQHEDSSPPPPPALPRIRPHWQPCPGLHRWLHLQPWQEGGDARGSLPPCPCPSPRPCSPPHAKPSSFLPRHPSPSCRPLPPPCSHPSISQQNVLQTYCSPRPRPPPQAQLLPGDGDGDGGGLHPRLRDQVHEG